MSGKETHIQRTRREALERYVAEKEAKYEARRFAEQVKAREKRNASKVPAKRRRPSKPKKSTPTVETVQIDGYELPKEVLGINTKKFMRLVKKRTTDDLHQSVDAVQAMSALTMFYVIEQCETGAKISNMDADDRVKMLNAIKGASASANDTLKALNITAATREEVDLTDEALIRLSKENIEDNLPPSLQSEYLRAQEDVARISGKVDEATQAEQQALVDEIKKPVESGTNKDQDDKVTHVDQVGIGGLG
jgi:hypothetical protein